MSLKKIPVTVSYSSPGAQPPIYVAGSFSGWVPQEMDFTIDSNNEHQFKKDLLVEEGGVFQYKFRIGDGDWWALNEHAPSVTDDLGNRNNLLTAPVLESKSAMSPPSDPSPVPDAAKDREEKSSSNSSVLKADESAEGSKHKENERTEPILWKTEAKTEESATDSTPASIPIKAEGQEGNLTEIVPTNDTAGQPSSSITEDPSALPPPVPTSGAMYENFGESSGSETILTPQTPLSAQEEGYDTTSKETTEEYHEKTPTPPQAHTPIPKILVEKVDGEHPSREDLESNEVTGPKETHETGAHDAEPDFVAKPETNQKSGPAAEVTDSAVTLNKAGLPLFEASTPEPSTASAQSPDEIASEVADSAAILDKEDPEPLSPDDEAGRTGERRLSHTPIGQVANTAAEVADTAAFLDRNNFKVELPRFKFVDPDSGSGSGAATPAHEQAPLFAHECPEPYEEDQESSPLPVSDLPSQSYEDEEVLVNQDDPSLEQFPSDRDSILHTVRSCESRLDADETYFHGSPSSPVVGYDALLVDEDLEEPTSALLEPKPNASPQPSPVLDMIQEEQPVAEDMAPLPSPSKGVDFELVEKELPAGTTIAVHQITEDLTVPGQLLEKENSLTESPLEDRQFVTPTSNEQPRTSTPDKHEDVVLPRGAESDDPPKVKEPIMRQPDSTTIQIISPDTPDTQVNSDAVSFNASSIGRDNGPKIVIQPATPGVSEGFFNNVGTAKSTSMETDSNGKSNLKMRNQPTTKRTDTPTSLSSPHKDTDTQNIFEAIWRTVFVTWIGGLITRLCGGGRRP